MKTQFKWNDKQRLLIIESMAIAIENCNNVKHANQMGFDIAIIAAACADFLNSEEYIQKKLKFVFEMASTLGSTSLYDQLISLETNSNETKFNETNSDEITLSA